MVAKNESKYAQRMQKLNDDRSLVRREDLAINKFKQQKMVEAQHRLDMARDNVKLK